MITIKGKKFERIWYDLEIGYYTLWEYRWWYDGFIAEADISIPWDKEKKYCILTPDWPIYANEVFSKGTLNNR